MPNSNRYENKNVTSFYRRLTRRAFLKWSAATLASGALLSLTSCMQRPTSQPGPVTIIPRSDWGALEPDIRVNARGERGLYDRVTNPAGWLIYDRPLAQVLNTIVIHHSALPLSDGPLEIQTLHMNNKGFADIGYHFVVDDLGIIYEGRRIEVRGAHTGGHNTGTVGVVLMGNFEEVQPADAQITYTKRLISYLTAEYAITHLAGHRDFQPEETVCPGKNLEPLLPDWASELELEFGTGGYMGP